MTRILFMIVLLVPFVHAQQPTTPWGQWVTVESPLKVNGHNGPIGVIVYRADGGQLEVATCQPEFNPGCRVLRLKGRYLLYAYILVKTKGATRKSYELCEQGQTPTQSDCHEYWQFNSKVWAWCGKDPENDLKYDECAIWDFTNSVKEDILEKDKRKREEDN
jgi:hypothetical protein